MHIYTKQEFVQSVVHEMNVIRHLISKMPAEHADYRPSDTQRSTLELVQYLSYISSGIALAILTEDFSHFGPYAQDASQITMDTFADAFKAEEERFLAVMERFTAEDMNKLMSVFGAPEKTKGANLVDSVLKIITAYKMQLFLYVKTVNPAIGTSNAWGGYDTVQSAE